MEGKGCKEKEEGRRRGVRREEERRGIWGRKTGVRRGEEVRSRVRRGKEG